MEDMKNAIKNNGLFLLALAAIIMINILFDFFYIKTGSMEPELPVGTVVIVTPRARPRIGDVFAYENHGRIVIHRIVDTKDGGYIFQGDANPSPDGTVAGEEQMVGKVTAKIRFLAPILKALRSD